VEFRRGREPMGSETAWEEVWRVMERGERGAGTRVEVEGEARPETRVMGGGEWGAGDCVGSLGGGGGFLENMESMSLSSMDIGEVEVEPLGLPPLVLEEEEEALISMPSNKLTFTALESLLVVERMGPLEGFTGRTNWREEGPTKRSGLGSAGDCCCCRWCWWCWW